MWCNSAMGLFLFPPITVVIAKNGTVGMFCFLV